MKTMDSQAGNSADEVRARLTSLRNKRGYLLPHHGLLAVAEPELLEAYDGLYTALTLRPRSLAARDKEIVWLTVLVSMREEIGTHHLDRLKQSGGTDEDVKACVALAAWAEGADHFQFVEQHWSVHLPQFTAIDQYRHGLSALLDSYSVTQGTAEIALAATHQCKRRGNWVKEHLRGAYLCQTEERAIAEGLSFALFPGGVNNFVRACGHWRDLIIAGEVDASPPYKAWAELTGQGGFDDRDNLPPQESCRP